MSITMKPKEILWLVSEGHITKATAEDAIYLGEKYPAGRLALDLIRVVTERLFWEEVTREKDCERRR